MYVRNNTLKLFNVDDNIAKKCKKILQLKYRKGIHVSVYECVPIQNRSGVIFIQHLNVVRHLASSATENCKSNAHSARHELQIQLLRHHPQSLREADACLCVIIQTMRLNDLMAPPCCQARSSGVRNMSVCMSVSPSRFDLGSVSSSTSM